MNTNRRFKSSGFGKQHAVFFASLFACVTGCLGIPDNASAVNDFELERYLGTWYEIARLDHRFERDLSHVRAEYSLQDDGTVRVLNTGFNTKKNEWSAAEGTAKFIGDRNVGRLKVSFFGPFYGAYNIVELDKQNYGYALVIGPDTDYMWILARDPALDKAIVKQLVAKARALGFATDTLIYPEHRRPPPQRPATSSLKPHNNELLTMNSTTPVILTMESEPWSVVNDGVMGGISNSAVIAVEGGLRFQGTLSLENNGGFASIRRPINTKLAGAAHVAVQVRGDGRPYQLRLKTDVSGGDIDWRKEFDTNGMWQQLTLSLVDFEPVFRGRTLTLPDTADVSRLKQLGFLLADGQPGPFQLDIRAIQFK